ncbi:peptide ABC transporter permease [Salipaludibacillus keqinensis]|uniref:Peptide ABC transporter permease n=1 Tax=Salipaludibacillus keqinensis TaxID=2045207 RepID=A0A323TD25_9BACI|nr:ABC transporter permease [Salipaludibacillus keqinensis]PYZ92959.1 peptide ABC transporter permease [Salipaludibacillus keqinensis]
MKKHQKKSSFVRWMKLLLKSKTGTVGFLIVMVVFIVGIFSDQIAPFGVNEQNYANMLVPPAWQEGGSSEHFLGTDNLGRDILSRIIYGTTISLLVGIFSVVVAGILGMAAGLFAGYYGGWIDTVTMRMVDAFLSIPNILFILVILTVLNPGIMTLIFAIGVTNWVIYARLIRGEVLSVKEREYVKAARSIGTKNLTIIRRHVLPNVFSTFIVISTLSVATTIILEASLSFLGMGVQPPDVSWGYMLADGRDYLATNWWLATFPGLAITITVLGIIFLGDWLRDVLDPRSQGR